MNRGSKFASTSTSSNKSKKKVNFSNIEIDENETKSEQSNSLSLGPMKQWYWRTFPTIGNERLYHCKQRRLRCRFSSKSSNNSKLFRSAGQIVSSIVGDKTVAEVKKTAKLLFTAIIGIIARLVSRTMPNITSSPAAFYHYLLTKESSSASSASSSSAGSGRRIESVAAPNETNATNQTYVCDVSQLIVPTLQFLENIPLTNTPNASKIPTATTSTTDVMIECMKRICNHIGFKLSSNSPIGAGAFGKVFRVINRSNNRKFVIKCVKENSSMSQHNNGLREAHHMEKLWSHHNVAQLSGLFLSTTVPLSFIVMQSYDMDIYRYLQKGGGGGGGARCGEFGLHSRELEMIATGIGDAICYMHSHNIAHHDIKMDNIMLRLSAIPRFNNTVVATTSSCDRHSSHPPPIIHCVLADFGCARSYNVRPQDKENFLIKEAFYGTIRYMPAEVVKNHFNNVRKHPLLNVNPFLHDSYSFGVTMANMLLRNELSGDKQIHLGTKLIEKLQQKFAPKPKVSKVSIICQPAATASTTIGKPSNIPIVVPVRQQAASKPSQAPKAEPIRKPSTIEPPSPPAINVLDLKRAIMNEQAEHKLQSIYWLLGPLSTRKMIDKKWVDLWKK